MDAMLSFFATAPKGVEAVLADELRALGASEVSPARAGVAFSGSLEAAYRACLWSRTASRVLMPLARFRASNPDELYSGVRGVRWREHLRPEGTLAVDFSSSESAIEHTHFGALKVKDAVVDQLREETGTRPSVDTARPDVRLNLYLRRDEAVLSLDLSGESLHRRGWRAETAPAHMKENLAAAILLLARWPEVAGQGGGLVDPMCGSGTLPIEAALMAADVAPGLGRGAWGFLGWKGHDAALWARLMEEARGRDRRGQGKLPPAVGNDVDPRAISAAIANAERAGLRGLVHFEKRDLSDAAPVGEKPGVFVVNPPYGERLGEVESLRPLYGRIGDILKQRFKGWTGFVFTGNLELSKSVGLRAARRHVLFNGPIECRLLEIPIDLGGPTTPRAERPPRPLDPAAQAFANRLEKDFKHLSKWARREGVTCWRVYDADLPEYAVAVDLYEHWVHVQEYKPPKTVDAAKAEKRLRDVMRAVPEVLEVKPADVFLKVRHRQREGERYGRLAQTGRFETVQEAGHKFLVNFTDYLDTGLFLDHRITRAMVAELAKGRSFLNLFAYTGTATVYAAKGGATSTTTVDLSNTYLDWADRNLAANGIRGRSHELVRADALEFLSEERRRFGLIFLDPPTFSNSKGMEATFDVQRDHVALLRAAAALLEPGGVLLFSNNFRRFKMDAQALPELRIEDLTRKTLPPDFERNPRIHNAWRIERAPRGK